MNLLKKLLIASLLIFICSCTGDYTPKGKIIEVKTGDTVSIPFTFIDPNSEPRTFRLLAIKCPDPSDDDLLESYYGVLARLESEKWADERWVTLERPLVNSKGVMDRSQGWIKDLKTGEFLHESLLALGLARADLQGRDLDERGQRISQLENQARLNQRGIWSVQHPPEPEMRRVVAENASLFGKIVGVLRPGSTSKQNEKVVNQPVSPPNQTQPKQPTLTQGQNTVPELPQVVAGQVHQVVRVINDQADQARRSFLNWQALDQVQQRVHARSVRQKLRAVKIHIMDVFDEGAQLTDGQRVFLESLREEMNRLMGLVPRN